MCCSCSRAACWRRMWSLSTAPAAAHCPASAAQYQGSPGLMRNSKNRRASSSGTCGTCSARNAGVQGLHAPWSRCQRPLAPGPTSATPKQPGAVLKVERLSTRPPVAAQLSANRTSENIPFLYACERKYIHSGWTQHENGGSSAAQLAGLRHNACGGYRGADGSVQAVERHCSRQLGRHRTALARCRGRAGELLCAQAPPLRFSGCGVRQRHRRRSQLMSEPAITCPLGPPPLPAFWASSGARAWG